MRRLRAALVRLAGGFSRTRREREWTAEFQSHYRRQPARRHERGSVALVLAGVGIYGVLAYSVTARTREFGVRAALGADSGRVIALVLKTGARPVIGGLLVGNAGALALAGLLKSLLFGIGPRDPLTFIVVPSLLAAVALIAAYLPARRAARLEPMDALRAE